MRADDKKVMPIGTAWLPTAPPRPRVLKNATLIYFAIEPPRLYKAIEPIFACYAGHRRCYTTRPRSIHYKPMIFARRSHHSPPPAPIFYLFPLPAWSLIATAPMWARFSDIMLYDARSHDIFDEESG